MKYLKLSEICNPKQWKTLSTEQLLDKGFPVYGANGKIGYYSTYNHELPTIMITCRGATCGSINISEPKSWINGNAMCLDNLSSDVSLKYLAFYLQNYNFNHVISGSAQPQITREGLEKVKVKVYAKELQEKISIQLDKVQKIISESKAILEKYDTLIKSRFIEMFGDPVINEKDWDLKTLPELGEFGRGVSKHRPRNAPELLGGKYPLIQTGDVANANLYITDYESTYSEEGFKQSKMWKAGTLCITIAATIAKTAILTFDSCFPDSVVGFTPNEKTNSLFINYWFSFFQKILEEQAPAVAQKNINLQVLSELKIITPPISLQNDFAAFVQQIDKSKFTVQKSLEKAETLYKSLMQEYFA